ncbi:MAG: chromate transporter [Bacteroidales bacterium]|nr:chromate transporter [Bacteroidales bacterium]
MISLWEIFLVFAKIGAFTIGGGYMMVPAIQDEMSRRKWISEDELPDIVALAQSAPGLLTVNMAIFAGHRLRGVKGSLAATLGCIAAPFLIILAIAMFFSNFQDIPAVKSIFSGVRPAAVAIIAAYCVKLLKRQSHWWQWAIALATMTAMIFLKISAIYILLVTILLSVGIAELEQRRKA